MSEDRFSVSYGPETCVSVQIHGFGFLPRLTADEAIDLGQRLMRGGDWVYACPWGEPVTRVETPQGLGGRFFVVRRWATGPSLILADCPSRSAAEAALRLLAS
jgi:hypothetical protein